MGVNAAGFDGSELSGGGLTGRLLQVALAGAALLVMAAAAVFGPRRLAGLLAAAGAALGLPFYLYQLDPALFDGVGAGPRSVPGDGMIAGEWAALGLVTVAVVAFAFLRPPRRGVRRR